MQFRTGAFKVCRQDIPSVQSMINLPADLQVAIQEGVLPSVRNKNTKKRDKYRGPYRSYTMEEKQHVIELHNAGQTFASISKELSIPQKNVVRWCKEGEMGKDMSRRVSDVDLERELTNWINKRSW